MFQKVWGGEGCFRGFGGFWGFGRFRGVLGCLEGF